VPEDDAVRKHISESIRGGVAFGPDSIETGIRERVREVIQAIVNEELEAALGASASSRAGRQARGQAGPRARGQCQDGDAGAQLAIAGGDALALTRATQTTTASAPSSRSPRRTGRS